MTPKASEADTPRSDVIGHHGNTWTHGYCCDYFRR